MAKRKKERIGVIKGVDLIKKSAPKADVSFKTGRYMTDKDRPRDKSYKRYAIYKENDKNFTEDQKIVSK